MRKYSLTNTIRILYLIVPLVFIISCNTAEKEKPAITNTYDTSLIKGTWQYCDQNGLYNLMEISDSIFYYVDDGEYIGLYTPQGYIISGDTLAWILEDGKMDKSNMWQIKKLDSTRLFLRHAADTIDATRTKSQLLLKEYSAAKREAYIRQYQKLKSQYTCP